MHSEHPSYLPNVLKAYLNVTQDDKSNAFAVAISHLAVNLLTIEFTCLMMLALHYSIAQELQPSAMPLPGYGQVTDDIFLLQSCK